MNQRAGEAEQNEASAREVLAREYERNGLSGRSVREASGNWADRHRDTIAVSAMLRFAALTPKAERVEIPAGMRSWHGGDSAPADWDGRNCLTRAGDLVIPLSCARWMHTGATFEIVAYTPATPAEQTDQCGGEVEQLFWAWWHSGVDTRGPASAFHAGYAAALHPPQNSHTAAGGNND